MRLGINCDLRNDTVDEWLKERLDVNCKAVNFPLDYKDSIKDIDAYVKAAKENDIMIAEVGVWRNPLAEDENERADAMERCIEQLKLADYIGAKCCVNCAGSAGDFWCAFSPENFSADFYKRTVECIQEIIDKAAPKNTCYAIEPMPWIVPTGPDEYLKLIEDVNSECFGVHLDMCNWFNDMYRLRDQKAFIDEVFEKLGGKIVCHHLKDLRLVPGVTVNFEEVEVGDGMLDIDYYIKKINEDDIDAPVLIEHLHGKEAYLGSLRRLNKRFYGIDF